MSSRVLVVSSYPPRHCGIGAYAAAQVERMRAEGGSVVVLSPPDGDGDLRVPFLGGAALRRAASLGEGFDRIVVQYETGIWFRPHSPVTHVLTVASLLWLAVRRPQVEIVVHEAHTPPTLWRPDYALLRLAFARASLRFHSQAERSAFERAYRVRTRAAIVEHAPNVTVHAAMTKEAARKALGLGNERPLFVCAGFLQPDKGVERAIRAFATAGSSGRLAIVGSIRDITEENVRYAADLHALAERSERVTMLERFVSDDEFDAWVTAADVLVLPYRRAWSSGALARAERLGTPAFVSNVGGLAEQAGEHDRVFETDAELAELMRDAMRPPARRRRAAGTAGRAGAGSPPEADG
jgi:glycosyltransferase involved in cell wall biosynthesis